MMRKTLWLAAAAGAVASAANAEPTFFVFQNETLHRFTIGGSIGTFGQSDRLMGAARAPDGVIRGTSAISGPNGWEAYALDDPFGAPSLTMTSDTNAGPYAFVTYVGNTCYSMNSAGELLTLDPTTLAETGVVGNLGLGTGNVGAGYDAASDTFYLINKDTDNLYTVDYINATVLPVGPLGFDWFNAGAEFFGGKLYAAVQDPSAGLLQLGEIDTDTGAFTFLRTVASYDPNGNPMQVSLAIIPAPAVLALFGLGGLSAARRRR